MLFRVMQIFFFDLALIALPVLWFLGKEKNLGKAMKSLGFNAIGLKEFAKKSLMLFLALIAVSIWLDIAINFLGINDLELVSQSLEQSQAILPLFFWLIAVRVISEEVFFRGLLVKEIGIVPSTAIFAVFHLGYGSTAEVLSAFVLGLVLAKAFQLNKNLYPNIVAHLAYNAIILALL